MTQPAVSNHLNALEERFGVSLVIRGRRVEATQAGLCLAAHARSVLDRVEELKADMTLQAQPRGRLIIGASSTPGELLLPGLAARYSALYPDVALDIRVADTNAIISELLKRASEVAVVGRTPMEARLEWQVLGEDELVPIVAAEDPLANTIVKAEDIAGRAFVLREDGSATRWAAERGLNSIGLKPRVVMELGSNAAVEGAVAAGAGIGVVPERTVGSRASVRRLEIQGVRFLRPFVLIMERGRPLSPAARAFVEACIEGSAIESIK